jgi:hypothetical protein
VTSAPPTHLVHLIDHADPSTLALVRSLIAQPWAPPSSIWTVGHHAITDTAADLAMPIDRHLPCTTAVHALSRLSGPMRQMARLHGTVLFHGWSLRAAALASIAGAGAINGAKGTGVIATVNSESTMRTWATGLIRRRRIPVVTFSPLMRELLIRHRFRAEMIHVLDPILSEVQTASREALRRQWGLVDDRATVVLPVGGHVSEMDAMTAMLAVGLAAETARSIRLLIHPQAFGIDRARRMAAACGRDGVLLMDAVAGRPWEAAGAVDMALALGDGPGLGWAMAAGLPIVGRAGDLSHRLTDGTTALLSATTSPGALAQRIIELVDDPVRARQLGEAARQQVHHRTSDDVAQPWRRLYDASATAIGT